MSRILGWVMWMCAVGLLTEAEKVVKGMARFMCPKCKQRRMWTERVGPDGLPVSKFSLNPTGDVKGEGDKRRVKIVCDDCGHSWWSRNRYARWIWWTRTQAFTKGESGSVIE